MELSEVSRPYPAEKHFRHLCLWHWDFLMKFSQAPVESSLIPLVGIVSHVAELKERIDKKIIVTKKRTEDGAGSTICIEG